MAIARHDLGGTAESRLYGSLADKTLADPRWFGVTPRQIMQFVVTDLLRCQMSKLQN